MVERIPTCTSQAKASTSVALGRQMLRTSAPYMARSRPIAPPAITCPIPNARMPSSGFFPSFVKGIGSLSPIFSTVIKGIVERTSVYCGSLRNSSVVRTFASTRPSSAAAASKSSARHCNMAFSMDARLSVHRRNLSVSVFDRG